MEINRSGRIDVDQQNEGSIVTDDLGKEIKSGTPEFYLNKKWLIINTILFLIGSFVAYFIFSAISTVIPNMVVEGIIGQRLGLNDNISSDHVELYFGVLLYFIPATCIYFYFKISEDVPKLEQKILVQPYLFLVVLVLLMGGNISGNFNYLISLSATPLLFWNIEKSQIPKRAFIATLIVYLFQIFYSFMYVGMFATVQVGYVMWINLKTPLMLFFILLYHLIVGSLFVKLVNPHLKAKVGYNGKDILQKIYNQRFKDYITNILPYFLFKEADYKKKAFLTLWIFIGLIFLFSYAPSVDTIGHTGSGFFFSERYREWYENIPAFILFFAAPVAGIWGLNNWWVKRK